MSENSKKEHDVPPVPGVWNKKGLAEGHSAVAAQFKHTSTCTSQSGMHIIYMHVMLLLSPFCDALIHLSVKCHS